MPLRLTRGAGSKLFIGDDIDPDNMAMTATHTIWMRAVQTGEGIEEAILNISSPNRTIERVFEPEDSFKVAEGIKVKLKGCNNHLLPQPKFCPACGRGDQKSKRILPMAKIEVDAPRSIAVLRDDIKEKQ